MFMAGDILSKTILSSLKKFPLLVVPANPPLPTSPGGHLPSTEGLTVLLPASPLSESHRSDGSQFADLADFIFKANGSSTRGDCPVSAAGPSPLKLLHLNDKRGADSALVLP